MTRRLLDCTASDFASMGAAELLAAIRASEGRSLMCETAATTEPTLPELTNAEIVSALGADLLLLNCFDIDEPVVRGIPETVAGDDVIREVKRLTGRPVGINLEPVDARFAPPAGDTYAVPAGRTATAANATRAVEMGVDFIVLTGNPGAGVSNETIAVATAQLRENLGDRVVLISGRMHAAGVFGAAALGLLARDDIDAFADAGADVVLLPAPGTVPGVTVEAVRELIAHAHARGLLAMTAIGTSQEGADESTIRQLAIASKMAGADIHHLGDAGTLGIAVPENVLAYSIAIRGRRHTFARMARSIGR